MRKFLLSQYAPDTLAYYVRQIPLFNKLSVEAPQQLAMLLQHTFIMELEAGEVLIEKGTLGNIFYALVHGQLAIFKHRRPGDAAICELFPGQVLGALSVISQEPRTATVMVSSVEGATVLCTDYTVFGELEDFSRVALATKLCMFRDVAQHIHATLQAYELEVPDAGLSAELATLEDFSGEKNTIDELEYLAELATALGWLLDRWNARIVPAVPLFDEKLIESRLLALLRR